MAEGSLKDKAFLQQRIIEIIIKKIGVEPQKVTLSSRFRKDLEADSLEVLDVIQAVEREFGINLDDVPNDAISTVGRLIEIVAKRADERMAKS